ncbi:MAG: PadR family transcriptional regulator [Treponema sp.]|jgi:DNA-binding PadR family transcriptional regulator|nr:PadR family transcriptional regulator [Treponema sp.]
MSLKYGLLGLLNYGKMTGYELDKTFKDSLAFFWQGKTSQIYRELNAMEKTGWLSSERVVQTDKPNKKLYSLTAKGRLAFMEWLDAANRAVEEMLHVRSSFLMRLFFAGDLPREKTAAMLQDFQDKCRQSLQGMNGIPEHVEKYRVLIARPQNNTGHETKFHADPARLNVPEHASFWLMVADFGKSYYRTAEQWAEAMLLQLEKDRENT